MEKFITIYEGGFGQSRMVADDWKIGSQLYNSQSFGPQLRLNRGGCGLSKPIRFQNAPLAEYPTRRDEAGLKSLLAVGAGSSGSENLKGGRAETSGCGDIGPL